MAFFLCQWGPEQSSVELLIKQPAYWLLIATASELPFLTQLLSEGRASAMPLQRQTKQNKKAKAQEYAASSSQVEEDVLAVLPQVLHALQSL